MCKGRILTVLTGGTVCSEANENNENVSMGKNAQRKIIANFKNSRSPFATLTEFDVVSLKKDILSENMTLDIWEELLTIFRQEKTWADYRGIIVLHGTDTLAYTSAFLSMVLSGATLPVILVSAQLDLTKKETNGYDNFKTAAELIMKGIAPNVYAVYRNPENQYDPYGSMGEMFVHYGASLKQCGEYSHAFFSKDCENMDNFKGKPFATNSFFAEKIQKLSKGVLLIRPYTGLDYSNICLDKVKAVLHTGYHSQTLCIGEGEGSTYSVLYLLKKCKEKNIPCILTPCDENAYTYSTTGEFLRKGGCGIYGMTEETAYVKTIVGLSLGKEGDVLLDFLKTDINGEFIYK